jgi:histone deacetylase complex subunit SAP18
MIKYHHPLSCYLFHTIYADRGQFVQKGLSTVYSWDTLGDLGTIEQLLDNDSGDCGVQDSSDRQKDVCMLDELCLVPGDYLCVAVMLPKNLQANFSMTHRH